MFVCCCDVDFMNVLDFENHSNVITDVYCDTPTEFVNPLILIYELIGHGSSNRRRERLMNRKMQVPCHRACGLDLHRKANSLTGE